MLKRESVSCLVNGHPVCDTKKGTEGEKEKKECNPGHTTSSAQTFQERDEMNKGRKEMRQRGRPLAAHYHALSWTNGEEGGD